VKTVVVVTGAVVGGAVTGGAVTGGAVTGGAVTCVVPDDDGDVAPGAVEGGGAGAGTVVEGDRPAAGDGVSSADRPVEVPVAPCAVLLDPAGVRGTNFVADTECATSPTNAPVATNAAAKLTWVVRRTRSFARSRR